MILLNCKENMASFMEISIFPFKSIEIQRPCLTPCGQICCEGKFPVRTVVSHNQVCQLLITIMSTNCKYAYQITLRYVFGQIFGLKHCFINWT